MAATGRSPAKSQGIGPGDNVPVSGYGLRTNMPEIYYDGPLVKSLMASITPERSHDIRNAVSIYTGMAHLARDGDDFALRRLPIIERKLRRMVRKQTPPSN